MTLITRVLSTLVQILEFDESSRKVSESQLGTLELINSSFYPSLMFVGYDQMIQVTQLDFLSSLRYPKRRFLLFTSDAADKEISSICLSITKLLKTHSNYYSLFQNLLQQLRNSHVTDIGSHGFSTTFGNESYANRGFSENDSNLAGNAGLEQLSSTSMLKLVENEQENEFGDTGLENGYLLQILNLCNRLIANIAVEGDNNMNYDDFEALYNILEMILDEYTDLLWGLENDDTSRMCSCRYFRLFSIFFFSNNRI
jgi:hypothetical protein